MRKLALSFDTKVLITLGMFFPKLFTCHITEVSLQQQQLMITTIQNHMYFLRFQVGLIQQLLDYMIMKKDKVTDFWYENNKNKDTKTLSNIYCK